MNQPTRPEPTTTSTAPATTTPAAPADAFQQTWAQTHAQAVAVLTTACRLRFARTHSDGTTASSEPIDFADFLASVLAGVAANVGSMDRLVAGRPGSWEAGLVAQLVTGTVGEDEAWLYENRTEPVVVPLNVPALSWDLPGFPEVEDAVTHTLDRLRLSPDPQTAARIAEQLTDEQWLEYDEVRDAAEAAVLARYAQLYRAYADAFTDAVHAAAAQIAGLSVLVSVTCAHDPHEQAAAVVNPFDDLNCGAPDDELTARLWRAAAAAVPVPDAPAFDLPPLPDWLAALQAGTEQSTTLGPSAADARTNEWQER
ncbi:hypothetical protein [Kineosporia sp. A_224]|uniref:hypothetical protein n=1 Tax=Kineosporia sp. A_224 TaxID=1962180 RepID=UPI000B4AFFBD|nr:hypothetical protein [Kineosporia sp. A_224]